MILQATHICTCVGGRYLRMWKGRTESGIPLQALVMIRVDDSSDLGALMAELDRLPPDEVRNLDITDAFIDRHRTGEAPCTNPS